MTKEEKIIFIKALILDGETAILSKVDRMPEEWDGIELRKYITDTFADCIVGKRDKRLKRNRDYENTVLVNNL